MVMPSAAAPRGMIETRWTGSAVGDANVSGFTTITISGQEFKDLNGNGVKDAGEPGIDGVTITLDRGADGTVDTSTVTSGGGFYSFSGLGPGTYRIRQVSPPGFIQTTPNPPDVVAQTSQDLRNRYDTHGLPS